MKFTDRQIKNLKPKESRYEEWESNGLGIRIAPSGRKSWIFMYRYDGRARRMTLGTYPAMSVAEVHKAHGTALSDLDKGIDPGSKLVQQNQEERLASTVTEFASEYLEKWAKKRKRSWKEDERMLNKDVLPKIGRLKVKNVTRRDIIKLLDDVVERGASIVANRTFEVVRKMFNFAVDQGVIEVNPCLNIRAPSKTSQRERVLTKNEIAAFWRGLDNASMSEGVKLALKLSLITAQRRGEVAQMEWAEVDVNSQWWTIPASKSKNNLSHRVPLTSMAIDLLKQARSKSSGSKFVFPSPIGDKPIDPGALTRAIGKCRNELQISDFTPHDLRRTAASLMTSIGISRFIVSKVLNHAESGVTAVYDRHSYDLEKLDALRKWESELLDIISIENSENEHDAFKEETEIQNPYSISPWCESDDDEVKRAVTYARMGFIFDEFKVIEDLISKLIVFLRDNENHSAVRYEVDGDIVEPDDDVELLLQLHQNKVKPVFKSRNLAIYELLDLLTLHFSKSKNFRLALKACYSSKALGMTTVRKQMAGRKSVRNRAEDNQIRNQTIRDKARKMLADGNELKAIVMTLSESHGLSERQIRNLIKN